MLLKGWLSSWTTHRQRAPQKRRQSSRVKNLRANFATQAETLEQRIVLTPQVTSLALSNDTGTPGDSVTQDPTLAGQVDFAGAASTDVVVEIDTNLDGNYEQTVSPAADGNFTYDPSGNLTPGGSVTVQARAVDNMLLAFGDWVTLSFIYESSIPAGPPLVTGLQLQTDTGTDGDLITEDATLVGQVQYAAGLTGVIVEYDTDGDSSAEGVTVLNADGSFVVDPSGSLTPDTSAVVNVRAVDQLALLYGDWVTIAFTYQSAGGNTNIAPEATDDEVTTVEGASVIIDVLANDNDPDGASVTITAIGTPDHGSVVINSDGTITYAADDDAAADGTVTDSFTYTIEDSDEATATATLTVTILPNAALGGDRDYSIDAETAFYAGTNTGLLTGVDFALGTTLAAVLVSGPMNGQLILNENGSFVFTPPAGFSGDEVFDYEIQNEGETTGTGTVTLAVVPLVAFGESYATSRNRTLVAGPLFVTEDNPDPPDGLLANDQYGADGGANAELIGEPVNGSVVVYGDGSFSYSPDTDYLGTDSFTYRLESGQAMSSAVTVTIDVLNGAPIAEADSYTVSHDTTLSAQDLFTPEPNEDGTTPAVTLGVLGNDSDINDDPLRAILVIDTTHGLLTMNSLGQFVYQPNMEFVGQDSFQYIATDGFYQSDVTTVVIEVVNSAPIAGDDVFNTPHDTTLMGELQDGPADEETGEVPQEFVLPSVLGNDSDPDGDMVSAVLLSGPMNGTLNWSGDGVFTYTPNPGFVGTDTVTYHLTDGLADGNEATLTINVTNAATIANDDAFSISHDQRLVGGLGLSEEEMAEIEHWEFVSGILTNDDNSDEDRLTATLVSSTTNGELTFNEDSSFTYIPVEGFVGQDSFSYSLNDGVLESNTATVVIDVVNSAPEATNDSYTVNVNTRINGGYQFGDVTQEGAIIDDQMEAGLTANDSDEDGDRFDVILIDGAANGTLAVESDGTFSYLPNSDFVGTDSFTYQLSDGLASSDIATVTINVINEIPVAVADEYTVVQDKPLLAGTGYYSSDGTLLVNDSGFDGPTLDVILDSNPSNGELTWFGDGSFNYIPNLGFLGEDSFSYHLSDGLSDGDSATVTINVVNESPVGSGDTFTVANDVVLDVGTQEGRNSGVLSNDTDQDSDVLDAILVDQPANGTIDWNDNGTFKFTPDADFEGTDTFTYRVSDGNSTSELVTVTLNVQESSGAVQPDPLDPELEAQLQAAQDAFEQSIIDWENTVDGVIEATEAAFDAAAAEQAQVEADWNAGMSDAVADYEASIEPVNRDYFQAMAAADNVFNRQSAGHDDDFEDAVAVSEAASLVAYAQSNADYQNAVDGVVADQENAIASADADFDTDLAAAESAYVAVAKAAETAFDTTINSTFESYTTAIDSAGAGYGASEQQDWSTYQTALAASRATYNSDLAAAKATRDAVFNSYSSFSYNPGVAGSDTGFLGVLNTARQALLTDLDNAVTTFDNAKAAAESTFDAAVTSADNAYSAALVQASQDQTSADNTAHATKDSSYEAASDAYDAEMATAAQNQNNLLESAQNDFAAATGLAGDVLAAAKEAAQADYDQAVATATQDHTDATGLLDATYQAAGTALSNSYQSKRNAAQEVYDDAVAALENTYNGDVEGFQDDYDSQVFWLHLSRALDQGNANADYDAVVLPIYVAQALLDFEYALDLIPDTVYLPLTKINSIAVASADQVLAGWLGDINITFRTAERPFATTLAKKTADAANTLAHGTATQQGILGQKLADALKEFTLGTGNPGDPAGSIELEANHFIDLQYEHRTLKLAINDAQIVLDYANAAADKAHEIAMSMVQYNLDLGTNGAEWAYTNAEAVAWQNRADAFAAADTVLTNDLAAAEEAYVNDEAAATKVRDYAIADAETTQEIANLLAQQQYVWDATTAIVNFTSIVANARAAAIANYYGNTAEIIAMAYSQAAYEIAQVSLWSFQAVHDAAVAVIYGTVEAHSWNAAQHLFADAAENNTNAQAAAAVNLIAQEAAAAESHANAAHAAAVSLTAQAAAAEHLAADREAEHRRDKRQADAATDEIAAWGTADAAYDREIDHWWDVVDAAVAHANAEEFWASFKMKFQIIKLKAAAALDILRMHGEINIRTDKVKTAADQDETLAVEAEKEKKISNVKKFGDRVFELKKKDSMDAVFESGIWTVGVNSYLLNEGLDIGSNFVAGWADGLTAGYHSKLRDLLGINHFIDTSSGAYGLGQITGVVHSVILGVAGGGSHVGWAYTVARFQTAALTLASMIESGPKIWHDATTNEPREATAWDYLNMLPAVGYIFGKLTKGAGIFSCFVGNTEVAIGWQEPQLAAMEIPADMADAQWSQEWLIGGTGAMLLLTTWKIASNRRKDKRQRRLEDNYFTDRVFDDLHTSMLPEENEVKSTNDTTCEHPSRARDFSLPATPPENPSRAGNVSLPATRETATERGTGTPPCNQGGSRSDRKPQEDAESRTTPATTQSHKHLTLDAGLSTSRPWTFSKRATAMLTASLLFLAGFCFWNAAPTSFTGPKQQTAFASIAAPQPQRKLLTKPIQNIRVGQRVLAHNPELSDAERQNAIEPDPATWRHLSLRLRKQDNSFVEIEMLRPMEWVLANGVSLGSIIYLDLEEMGASGNAEVLNIGPCPPIEDREGEVVTATFSHKSHDVVDLYVDGLDNPIGVTTNHRIWSEDRQKFVPVAEFDAGESLRLADGTATQVERIVNLGQSQEVFNLEVCTEHVYHVGTTGLLVHNSYGPFHHRTTPEIAAKIKSSRELWGRAPRNFYQSHIPKAKAFDGPLPKGVSGIEFYTRVRPDVHIKGGQVLWSGIPFDEWAKIAIEFFD